MLGNVGASLGIVLGQDIVGLLFFHLGRWSIGLVGTGGLRCLLVVSCLVGLGSVFHVWCLLVVLRCCSVYPGGPRLKPKRGQLRPSSRPLVLAYRSLELGLGHGRAAPYAFTFGLLVQLLLGASTGATV